MSIFQKVSRLCSRSIALRNFNGQWRNSSSGTIFKGLFGMQNIRAMRILPIGGSIVAGYVLYKYLPQEEFQLNKETVVTPIKMKGSFNISRQVLYPTDNTGLKLILLQYQSCPFCCKVRAFLDYYGLSYDIVEVNPIFRSELSWTTYRKVPILLVETESGYQPLFDSSMIISALASFLRKSDLSVEDVANYYPIVGKLINMKATFVIEKKYDLIDVNESEAVTQEKMWRKWVDDDFVHVLTPNVYRTLPESYRTFKWFAESGEWENYFSSFTRSLIINSGAFVMWIVGWNVKSKYKLKNDVRLSLYDGMNHFLEAIAKNGTRFMGGAHPDLSDLSVYGVLKSIEGCQAFKDLWSNTNMADWFEAMDSEIKQHAGSVLLNLAENTETM